MAKIIVTDLTRFKNKDIVCTAGIDVETYRCVRPMPYLTSARCKELNILPGAILEGDFSPSKDITPPHTEDMRYKNLTFNGPCSPQEFEDVLEKTQVDSVSSGFDMDFKDGQKHIPNDHALDHSIISIKIAPRSINIVQDKYDPSKIKVHFRDGAGKVFRYISITDLGFYDYAERLFEQHGSLAEVNDFITSQDEVYLRVGLSRPYAAQDGREGCWIQCNGIYTFPEFHQGIRSYGN